MPPVKITPERRIVLRAVHPNAGVTSWYRRQLEDLISEAWLDAALMLTLAYRDRPRGVGLSADHALALDAPAGSIKKIDDALRRWGKKWNSRFDRMANEIAAGFTRKAFSMTNAAMQDAMRAAGFTVRFKPTRASMQAYRLVLADNVGLIKNIQQQFYNRIQQDVWASVRAGSDMSALSTKLQESYGITKKRAALISRDQNAKAKAVIETTRRQELGITKAVWQHSSAGKESRPVHAAWGREAKVFDLSKGLYDPDAGEYVFPGQLINCRCTSRAIIEGFDE